MRGIALFAGVSFLAMAAAGALLALAFSSPAGREAVLVSGFVAFGVQLITYAIARGMRDSNAMAGWGLGMLLRFVTLVIYAFAILGAFGLAPAAALMSLATFLFISTLIEPWLLTS